MFTNDSYGYTNFDIVERPISSVLHFHKIRLWQIIMNVNVSNVFSLFDSSGTAEK